MLDGAHAELDRAANALARIGVGGDVSVRTPGLVDDGRDLIGGILDVVEGVGDRDDPAAGHDLDLVGAEAQLVADRLLYVFDAVGDAA